jgi:hypothetical protein
MSEVRRQRTSHERHIALDYYATFLATPRGPETGGADHRDPCAERTYNKSTYCNRTAAHGATMFYGFARSECARVKPMNNNKDVFFVIGRLHRTFLLMTRRPHRPKRWFPSVSSQRNTVKLVLYSRVAPSGVCDHVKRVKAVFIVHSQDWFIAARRWNERQENNKEKGK